MRGSILRSMLPTGVVRRDTQSDSHATGRGQRRLRNRVTAFGALIAAPLLAAALLWTSAAPALADGKPERVFLDAQNQVFPAGMVCDFDVSYEVLINQEYGLFFFFPPAADGTQRLIVTGHLVIQLTNLQQPSRSVVLNVSGPGTYLFHPDGTLSVVGRGINFLYLFPTDDGGPGMWVTSGKLRIEIDAGGNATLVIQPNRSQDLCAALGA